MTPTSPTSPSSQSSLIRKALLVLAAALALVVVLPGTALADPPAALPANADELEQTFQPAYDYDTDGCYPTPAIGPDGTVNGGLNPSGDLNGECRDAWDLDNTNGYARYTCNNGWCAIMYGLYFEKDQALAGSSVGGHRHDWEHVVVWVPEGQSEAAYVATSAHGDFNVYGRDQIQWDGTHPKIVYHKDGIGTHAFRPATTGDEPPENHEGAWQYPALVGWNGYPGDLRDRLSQADFGSATFGLRDASFASHLERALPAGIPFDPSGGGSSEHTLDRVRVADSPAYLLDMRTAPPPARAWLRGTRPTRDIGPSGDPYQPYALAEGHDVLIHLHAYGPANPLEGGRRD